MEKIKVFAVVLCLVVVFPVYAFEQEEKEIVLMGTAHIFDVKGKIREEILEFKPDAIAVELDENFFNIALNWVKSKQATSKNMSEMAGPNNTSKKNLTEALDYAWELFLLHCAIDMLAGITIAQELNIPVYPIAPAGGMFFRFKIYRPF